MADSDKPSLAAQRCLLQKKLQAQRQHLAVQLAAPEIAASHYPRSMIMRFLTGRSGSRLMTEAASFVLGPHYARSISFARIASQLFFPAKKK